MQVDIFQYFVVLCFTKSVGGSAVPKPLIEKDKIIRIDSSLSFYWLTWLISWTDDIEAFSGKLSIILRANLKKQTDQKAISFYLSMMTGSVHFKTLLAAK